jgi:hypothetical protein
VVLTFSTVGDSRQDPQNIDPSVVQSAQIGVGTCPLPSGTGTTPNPGLSGQDCLWLQNAKAWSRVMRSIQSQKANLLFFNGDMIMGYGKAGVPVTRTSNGVGEAVIATPTVSDIVGSDLMQFYQQYAFWRGMISNMMETGTYIVPVPGNHEVQCKRCSKVAQAENETAWRNNMGDLILDTARFTSLVGSAPQNWDVNNAPSTADGLSTDQKQLSYSFDVGTSHFVVINTDPVGKDGRAPVQWLTADFAAAQTHGAKRIFVFGHKPYQFYAYTGSAAPSNTSSLFDKDATTANAFWNLMVSYKATYFCGHEHIYKVSNYLAPDNSGNSAYQVLVGAGGSPFESSVATGTVTDRMYSWATVKVFQSGKVIMDTYGFEPPASGNTNPIVKLQTLQLPTLQ